ncbi:dienelactone hydrolase family protein [Caldalkalibacillus mannanilyticus]|uniref:dienelactone hydrolase family protein n=1 Tax=Caldalkalibacillus mannanilyticus TaxID=1418 RepID=UPI000468C30C|nr:dienelactone hydrolase family protein [Caldalkalibacillus mannanilyticus]
MVKQLNKVDKLIIVIHEIYGINQHMTNFCERLTEEGFDVICPNLLKHEQTFDYSEEEIAYQNFIKNVGFTDAVYKIKNVLVSIKKEYKKIYIIGFSIGATVAWLCSEEDDLDGIVGYYGSRIRDFKDIVPSSPTILFFPQKEQSFDVNELISNLDKSNTEIHKFNGEHGFSDPYSPKYNEKSAEGAFDKMLDFIRKH